jgi:hypothetical protein
MSVTLYSCSTGQTPDGYAQQLADAMGTGAVVKAPTTTLWLYISGKEPPVYENKVNSKGQELNKPDTSKPGTMATFVGSTQNQTLLPNAP